MDTKKYEAMVTSVEQGSFTRAAEALGYTQSGLTHMMNSLESEVGFQLLQRGHFGIRLTPNGEQLLPLVEEFLQTSRRLQTEIDTINQQANETITIGAYSSIAIHWLPTILDRFRQVCPGVRVNTYDETRPQLFAAVQSGRFDLAFTSEPTNENVDWIPLAEDPLMALLPKSAVAEPRTAYPVQAYEGLQFLMPAHGYDADILKVLDAHGVRPEILNTAVGDPAIVSMVAHGLGVSMLSELCIRGYEEHVTILPLVPHHSRNLGVILRRSAAVKPVVRRLVDCARETVEELYRK